MDVTQLKSQASVTVKCVTNSAPAGGVHAIIVGSSTAMVTDAISFQTKAPMATAVYNLTGFYLFI